MSEEVEKLPKSKADKKRRRLTALGVAAVVLLVAGFGFYQWHETPGFCGAICHKSMNAYVQTLTEGHVDKYGNDLDDTESMAMMSYMHAQVGDVLCLDCHVPTIEEQITEGACWVTGNYYVLGENRKGDYTLTPRSTYALGAWQGWETGQDFCLREGCHQDASGKEILTLEELQAQTVDLSAERNPHAFEHKELDCSECHRGHAQSFNQCTTCHDDAPVPDGWLTYEEAKEKQVLTQEGIDAVEQAEEPAAA